MEKSTYTPLLISPNAAVLLVFQPGLLSAPGRSVSRLETELLLERIRAVFGPDLRITLVDDSLHPEVVSSFSVRSLPSFILIQQGIEIWRFTGLPENGEFIQQLSEQIQRLPVRR